MKEKIMTKPSFNNSIILSRVKGNLVEDPSEEKISGKGTPYRAVTLACNDVTQNAAEESATWYPRVVFLAECKDFAAGLSKGDFIEITSAILIPGELQSPWVDKKGEHRSQNSGLMVNPLRSDEGVTIPVKIIKKKNAPSTKNNKSQSQEQQKMFDNKVKEEISSSEQDVVAQITA
jgi:single-stranded DNA-binding protein